MRSGSPSLAAAARVEARQLPYPSHATTIAQTSPNGRIHARAPASRRRIASAMPSLANSSSTVMPAAPPRSASWRSGSEGYSPWPRVSPSSFGNSHSQPTHAQAPASARSPAPCWRPTCWRTSANTSSCGCSSGDASSSMPAGLPRPVKSPIAWPNQANAAALKATLIATPPASARASEVRASRASNHGTSAMKPNRYALPPRAYSPSSSPLASTPASRCQPGPRR